MAETSYSQGMQYEAFMGYAYGFGSTTKGANQATMTNLIDAEAGKSWVAHLPPAAKQFEKVKGYIDKALNQLLKKALDPSAKATMKRLKLQLAEARNSADLMAVVQTCLNTLAGE